MGNHGIAELYGYSMVKPTAAAVRDWAKGINADHDCPFQIGPDGQPLKCKKKGGVCSITEYAGAAPKPGAPIAVTCPQRFKEEGLIYNTISSKLFGDADYVVLKELDFLEAGAPLEGEGGEPDVSVGRIDNIIAAVDAGKIENWCALEIQAVYFSGKEMGPEGNAAAQTAADAVAAGGTDDARVVSGFAPPVPGTRRPDFRSSGPKRLLPQLEVKVPSVRRWGKKTAVVIDRPFFDSMRSGIEAANDLSNADILWMVFEVTPADGGRGTSLVLNEILAATLESSRKGLVGGEATPLATFQAQIDSKLPVALLEARRPEAVDIIMPLTGWNKGVYLPKGSQIRALLRSIAASNLSDDFCQRLANRMAEWRASDGTTGAEKRFAEELLKLFQARGFEPALPSA